MATSDNLVVVNTETAIALNALAVNMAAEAGDKLSSTIDSLTKAKEDWEGGPIAVWLKMTEVYGDKLDAFPDPDAETGNNPAKYKAPVVGTNGKTVNRVTDWYVTFADATPEGVRYAQELAWLKRLNDENDNLKGIEAAFINEYQSNPQLIARRKEFIERRRGIVRNAYRKAMALKVQFDRVNSIGDGVEADLIWIKGQEGKAVENLAKPVMVWETAEEGKPIVKWSHMSIGSFLKLNPAKALENGGSYQALLDTVKRDSKKGNGKGEEGAAAKTQLIRTADTFAARMTDIHEFFSFVQDQKDNKDWMELQKAIDGAGSDDLFLSAWAIRDTLNELLKGDKRAVRHERLMQEERDAA